MIVEVLPSSSSYTDDDQKNLKQLLEAFGSVVSLEDIASAYCEAGRNLCSTAEVLCNLQGSIAGTSSSKSQDDIENTSCASSGCPSSNVLKNAHSAKLKLKKCSASVGTVSDVIGKDYITPRPQAVELNKKSKPVKLNSDDFPVSEIWDEKNELASTSRTESMDSNTEEFLCKLLGNGFQLEMNVIQDVVGQCGYNMQKSIDKLIDLSAATLEKSDDIIEIAAGNTVKRSLDQESVPRRTQSLLANPSGRLNTDANSGDELLLPQKETKKKDLQRELLEAIFSVPDRFEEMQKAIAPTRPVRRSPYGQVVAKPLEDTIAKDFTFITRQPVTDRNVEVNQSSYEDLRKGVTEYWVTMKEYYAAAVDAFTEKDYEKAQKFLEEGQFFMKKAREADGKSAQKLIEDSNDEEIFSLNMHYLKPKDALRHMKLNLISFSGLPSIHYLKVVVGTNTGDSKDERRKRVIVKLLEKEGIPWTEEGDGWIIAVRVDVIDPKKLSFADK